MSYAQYREVSERLDTAEYQWINHLTRCPKNHDSDVQGKSQCATGEQFFAAYQIARSEWLATPVI